MLYILNSGYRNLYLTNTLNTLFLPSGCFNEYRYHYKGEEIHVSDEIINELPYLFDKEVLIIFVDRYNPTGYVFHPMRLGSLVNYHKEDDDKIYLKVQLGKFIYPKNITEFNQELISNFTDQNLPKLTDNNPDFVNDGYYVIKGINIFKKKSLLLYQDDAWSRIVDALKSTSAFSRTQNNNVVFLKTELLDSSNQIVKLNKSISYPFPLKRDHQYSLKMTYIFPAQNNDRNRDETISVTFEEPIISPNTSSFRLNATSNSININFKTHIPQ